MKEKLTNKEDYSKLIDKDKYQVFLFKSRAVFPFVFASHPWFVLNKKGDISRWEVDFFGARPKTHWGYLYKDLFPIFQGTEIISYLDNIFHKATLLGKVEGEDALKMINFISDSPHTYKYCKKYHLWGPNSNTYAQWVINNFPESKFKLPENSYGKNFKY